MALQYSAIQEGCKEILKVLEEGNTLVPYVLQISMGDGNKLAYRQPICLSANVKKNQNRFLIYL